MSLEHVNAGVELFKGAGRLAGELFGFDDLNPFAHIADFDGAQDAGVVELAHHATGSGVDDAPPIRILGNDSVDKDGFRPSDLENKSANPDLKENLNKGVDALKDADPSMSQEKADAIKAAVADPEGWTEKRGSDLTGKKVLMADGDKIDDFGAKKHTLDLAPDAIVYTKEVEYTVNGQTYTETIYVPQDCANVSIDIEADKPEAVPAPVVPADTCPIDGTLLDGKADGAYVADKEQAYWDDGERKFAPVRAVIESDSLEDAQNAGLADHRANPNSFTHIYYRDAEGCLHYVGCIKPGGDRIGTETLWDKDYIGAEGKPDDTDGDGLYEKGEGRKLVAGESHQAVESSKMVEDDLKKQGITKFE